MQHHPVNVSLDAAPASSSDAAPRGPVLLDSHLLRLVAGGAPKGGWEGDGVVGEGGGANLIEPPAPKGGW